MGDTTSCVRRGGVSSTVPAIILPRWGCSLLSIIQEEREEIERQSVPTIRPPTPDTVDSLRRLVPQGFAHDPSTYEDPLVSGYASQRQSDLQRLAATPGAAESFAAFDASQRIRPFGPTISMQPNPARRFFEATQPAVNAANERNMTPEQLAQQPDFSGNTYARSYSAPTDTLGGGIRSVVSGLRAIDRNIGREIASPLTGATPANPAGSEGTLLGGEDRNPLVKIARGFVEEGARPSSLAAMAVPLAGGGTLAGRVMKNALAQGGANVALDLLMGRTDPKELAMSAGLGAALGAGLPEIAGAVRELRAFGKTPEGKAAIKRLASESGMAKIPGEGEQSLSAIRAAKTRLDKKQTALAEEIMAAGGDRTQHPRWPEYEAGERRSLELTMQETAARESKSRVARAQVENSANLHAAEVKQFLHSADQDIVKMPLGETREVTSKAGQPLRIQRTGQDRFYFEQLSPEGTPGPQTTTGPGELVPAARPAPPEPATAAPESSLRGGGAGEAPPPTALAPEPPVGPSERVRVSQAFAKAIERQAPIYAEQKAVESAERGQRFARVRAIRKDPTLTPQERIIESKRALSGELAADMKKQYTPMEISDSDFDIAERMIRDSDLREGEWLGAMVGIAKMRSGGYATPGEVEKMGAVFGPELVAAIRKRNQSLASNIARTWGVSEGDVLRAARSEELATAAKVKPSTIDTAQQVASRRLDTLVGDALDKAIERRIKAQAQQEARALREMNAEIGRSGRQMTRETDKYLKTTPEGLGKRAAEMVPEDKRPMISEAIRYWSEGNRAIIDGVGDTQGLGQMMRLVQTAFSGEVTDSWVAKLASRRAFLEMALLREGIEPKTVGKIGQMMMDRETQFRFGRNIPDSTQRSLDMLKGVPLQGAKGSTTGTILEALASGSEEFKNLMFGVDLGVFGIQARAAVQGGLWPGLAGAINRTLARMHAPHFGELYLDTTLDRQTANMLDGLYHGRGPAAVTAKGDRGIMMNLPVYGKVVDKLTEFQFNTVLGGMRDTLYEGNLLVLHLLGRDIKSPKTRARAAEWANTLTGFGQGAQTGLRKKVERAGLVSPSMTRAQFSEILSVGRLLSPTADADQRILAALAIASYGTTWLAAGKLINDYFGKRDYEFDPTKPGAGVISFSIPGMGETSVPFMANASLKRTFAQSMRYLAEGDEEGLTNAWLRYASAREATAGRGAIGLTTGRGYTPEGKFSTDLSREDLAKSLIPAPPAVQSAVTRGLNPVRVGLESLGVNNYPRSVFDKADETIAQNNGDFRAALLASEGDTRDIVKYRWRQSLEPKIKAIGGYVVKGAPGRAPRIEFSEWDAKEAEAIPRLIEKFPESTRPAGDFKTISELRAAMIEHNLNAYMTAHNVGISEARAQLGNNFDRFESVKNARANEAAFRLNKWRANPALLEEASAVDWETLNEEERKIAGVR